MKRPEQALQKSVVQLLTLYERRGALAFCAVPNGGARSRTEAAIMAGLGVRSGVPDIIVWTDSGHSFGIELKGPRGKESDAQVLFRSTLASLGHRVYVCWSLDEVEAALRLERVPMVGKIAGGHQAGSQRVLEAIP